MIPTALRRQQVKPGWHTQFLAMLPIIERHARIAFRHLAREAREDAVQETIANALVAFVRLVQRNMGHVAYPTVLARYAVAQIHDGRRVGNRLNVREVLSPYAQKHKRFTVKRLDRFDTTENEWIQALVEDHRTPVADQVAFRCDFPAWLASLPGRTRRIVQALAAGHGTGDVAKRFGVSPSRISQLRGQLRQSWHEFHGEAGDGTQIVDEN